MKRKFLLLMMTALLPVAASAYDVCIDGIYYNVVKKAKQATVTYGENESGTYSGSVVIPETITYDGVVCDVVAIDTYAFSSCNLTSITIPKSIVRMGGYYSFSGRINAVYISDLSAWCAIEGMNNYGPLARAEHFYVNGQEVHDLVIPQGVTKIESGVFYGAKMLTSVTIPEGVTEIGGAVGSISVGTFEDCTALQSVKLPSSLKSIGQRDFKGCTGIATVNIANANIGNSAFQGCSSLTTVTIGDGVETVGRQSFYNCTSLSSVKIGNNVKKLENGAFRDCENLSSVVIPNSVESLGEYNTITMSSRRGGTFEGCSKLSSVTIGSGVAKMKENTFRGCSNLTDVHIKDLEKWCQIEFEDAECNPLYFAKHLFVEGQGEIVDLVVPASISTLPNYAFYGFSGIKSVTIPETVKYIYTAFGENDNLKSVSIGGKTIDNRIYIKESFNSCSNLSTITLGNGVPRISGSFRYCKELSDVYISAPLPSYKSYESTFSGSMVEYATLHVNSAFLDEYKATAPWSGFGTIVALKQGDPAFDWVTDFKFIEFADSKVKEICIYNWDTNDDGKLTEEEAAAVKDLGTVFRGQKITSFDELKYFTGLTAIGNYAFNGCSSLESLVLPEGITAIGSYAFKGCSSLENIVLPEGLTAIDKYTFDGCSSLESIVLQDGVTTIDIYAFRGCSSLENIVFPEGLTDIGGHAFSGCGSLATMTLPSTIRTVSNSAFSDCMNLQSVAVPTLETWLAIKFAEYGAPFYRDACFNLLVGGEKVTDLVIPDEVTEIGPYKFYGCSGTFTSITLHSGIKSIGYRAFEGCDNLDRVYSYAKQPVKPDYRAFVATDADFNYASLYVPKGSAQLYEATEGWGDVFAEIIEMEAEQEPGDVDGDGEVTAKDIVALAGVIAAGSNATAADVNGDGVVNIADLVRLTNLLAAPAK